MSTSEAATVSPSADDSKVQRAELDISKLHALPSEQQDLYLLTFTSDLAQHVSSLNRTQICAQQASLKNELLKILNLSFPTITRVLRNNVGKCFGVMLSKGDRSVLYDTVNELLALVNDRKNTELKTKFAAVHCLGDVFESAGDSAVNLSNTTVSSLLKLLKTSNNHTGLRACIFATLRKVVTGLIQPIDESTARDIWKHARNAATNDKSFLVQINACRCIEQLVVTTPYLDNTNDFDHLKAVIWKAIDSHVPRVRHAAAACLARSLVKNCSLQVEDKLAQKSRKQKWQSKKPATKVEKEDESEIPESEAQKVEPRPAFGLSDIFRQLSAQYLRASIGNRARVGIAISYKYVIRNLGENVVREHYNQIAAHLIFDLLNHPTVTYNRFRLVMTRRVVKNILEDTIGHELLRESSQLNAAKWLINDVLKDYPQVIQERREPSKYSLTCALSALSSLISSLGSAIGVIADGCREALLQVLPHPSYTVQVHTAQCLRTFVLACPYQVLPCVSVCLNSLTREIGLLSTPRQSSRRCLGFANGLSAMLGTSRIQPLYGSVEVFSRVLSQATELLKSSSASELRVASTQIQVAWILIGGLMPLGPSFAKIHLSQLMLVWRNALPRPLGKENIAQQGSLELSFLAHVRECALGSILSFLEFNGKLVTADGSRRIAIMLQNTIAFLDGLPRQKSVEDISQRLFPSLQLHDFAIMVRRRVLQCFSKLVTLSHSGHNDVISQSSLISLAISSFADPDVAHASHVESSILASTSQFESLWDLCDNFGFGVTGLAREYVSEALTGKHSWNSGPTWSAAEPTDQAIDDILIFPVCQASEHDSILLYCSADGSPSSIADPPITTVVNAAIDLFALTLPLQPPKVQESSVEQIATLLSSQSLQRYPGRKAAMTVNIAVALLHALKVAVRETGSLPGHLNSSTAKILQEILQKFTVDPDPVVRTIGFEALGRLCNSAGNAFTNAQIGWIVDTIVENRDPNTRAGCAAALGCIHSQVGGMAAGFHLKTVVGVLMSLCNDPHPVVHFWALGGLLRVTDTAGLTFSSYVSSSLGMLAQLYIADTHNEESASLATSNIEMIFPTPYIISCCADSLINVVGPDLQDISKTRNLILTLVRQFQLEESPSLVIQSLRCLDHLSFYAPAHVDFAAYVKRLQSKLTSEFSVMRDAAVRGLSNLMKRDAEEVINTASATFEDEIWFAFDDAPDSDPLKNMIENWLQQTALSHTETWVYRFQRILTKSRMKVDDISSNNLTETVAPEQPDDEVAGFATSVAGAGQVDSVEEAAIGQELLKWQTRNFAMNCLSELLLTVNDRILPDQTIPAEAALQQNVGDIVRMAFSASTANVIEVRVWGLKIIDQVLKLFGKTPDPDFTEASLLEQYQAQISSALTPAFAADSSPELASEAINVCATFIGAGIVTNVDRMGRILKFLVVGLENFAQNPETTEIADLKGLNPNAKVMIKTALFSAWARLQIASTEQEYLVAVVQPYTAMLTPLWLSSLREYARLRFEPDISGALGTSPLSENLNEVYSALNRETLLRFYQDSWLSLVDAIASLVGKDSDFVFDALDGKFRHTSKPEDIQEDEHQVNGVGNGIANNNHINYRDEPVAFFFVLFGLALEALVTQKITPSQRFGILQALKKILRPAISGNSVYQDAVFSETMDTLDRLVLTESHNIQSVIVEIARNLSLDHPSAKATQDRSGNLSEDIEQLFELTRIITLVLAEMLPNLGDPTPHARFTVASEDALALIRLALSSLVDVASIFPSVIRHDLHACILHIFCTILATGVCQAEVVPQALPIFRRFIQEMSLPNTSAQNATTSSPGNSTTLFLQLRGCLSRFFTILTVAQRRGSDTSVPCAKNTLLALTILLTCSSHVIPPQDPVIPRVLSEFLDCLQDVGLANVAAGCIRSILLTPAPRSPTDEVISRFLLPRLIAFVAGIPSWSGVIVTDPENSRTVITHALVSFVGSSAINRKSLPVAVSMVLSALLTRAKNEGIAVFQETAARLLELAKIDQAVFRSLVAGMAPEQKTFVEEILRNTGTDATTNRGSRTGGGFDVDEQKNGPSITLRMDF